MLAYAEKIKERHGWGICESQCGDRQAGDSVYRTVIGKVSLESAVQCESVG